MEYRTIKQQDITKIKINGELLSVLKRNKIRIISQLCNKTKKQLKEFGIKQSDIKQIEIELELLGLDLKND